MVVVMEINKEREAFEKLQNPKFFKCAVYLDNSNAYVVNDEYRDDLFSLEWVQEINYGWLMWQAAKAIPEGFVLVPVKEIKTWFLDESENIYREDPDWLCNIPIGEVVEVEHRVSYEMEQDPVFAAIRWDEINGDVGYYETFKSKEEAEKVAAHCKAMIEAQEQSHD